jgi:hypothetical protein
MEKARATMQRLQRNWDRKILQIPELDEVRKSGRQNAGTPKSFEFITLPISAAIAEPSQN